MMTESRFSRRRRWAKERQETADTWFGGDADRADEILELLPYSAIPDWSDVDEILSAITGNTVGPVTDLTDQTDRAVAEAKKRWPPGPAPTTPTGWLDEGRASGFVLGAQWAANQTARAVEQPTRTEQ